MRAEFSSRIHERTILLRFLGIILRVSVWILEPQGKGCGFLSGFPPFSFTMYSNWTVETVRGCVSLKKYKSQGKAVELTLNSNEENFEDFCLDFVQEFGLCMEVEEYLLALLRFEENKAWDSKPAKIRSHVKILQHVNCAETFNCEVCVHICKFLRTKSVSGLRWNSWI